VDGDEELLGGNPRLGRPVRLAAILFAAAAIAALIIVHTWPHARHSATTAPPSSAPPSAPVPSTWPVKTGVCGNTQLPIVSSTRPAEHTGIRVVLGGDRLRTVDFDTGRSSDTPSLSLAHDEFVSAIEPGAVVTAQCLSGAAQVLRLADGGSTVLASGGVALLGQGRAVMDTTVVPLGRGGAVQLPTDFQPEAVAGNVVAGQDPPGLVLVDAATGHIAARLGEGATVAADDRMLVWTGPCDNPSNPCPLHRRMLATGVTTNYSVPRSPRGLDGVISHDRTQLAFTLRRAEHDPRFAAEHPAPPADIAILHFDTGRLDIVPGVELPPLGFGATLAFSPDDRWLVIALNAGSTTRLLAWRPGLARPYECPPIPAKVLYAPPLEVLG
jgi:hypothetical protein